MDPCFDSPQIKIVRQLILTFLFGFAGIIQVSAQTDSLILSNGDVIVGEIKSMDKGIIQIETDYSDTDFKIEWDKVSEIYSPRTYLITLSDGTRINEPINTNPDSPHQLIIGVGAASRTIDLIDLVYINPLEKTFISRMSAAVSIGYNFTKNNNLSQFSSRISLGYLADFWSLNGSLDIVLSSQDEVEDISRTDGLITFQYFLKNDWFLLGKIDFLSNTEQKLDLRSAPSIGVGKYLVHSNKFNVALSGGGVWNNETFTDETPDRSSAEAFLGGNLDIFDIGDLDLLTSLTVYPSLTESGRVRTDFKFDLKYDLPLDFFINLGFTLNYDNQPIEGASEADYVIQTTLGWDL
jgi:putative salt-induced outer membrane protein YdiY